MYINDTTNEASGIDSGPASNGVLSDVNRTKFGPKAHITPWKKKLMFAVQ